MERKRPARHRMSSRELREKMSHDPLVDTINWLRKTWSQHGGKITWGLAAFLVAYFAVSFYLNQRRSRFDQASVLLDVAQDDYAESWTKQGEEKTKLQSSAVGSIDNLVATFSGSPQAVQALLLKGTILYEQGRYGEAEEVYQTALAQARKPETVVMSRLGIAQCRANLEGPEAGIMELESILAEHPATHFTDQIHLQIARLCESAGDTEKALAHYDRVQDDSAFLDDTTKRHIEFLKAPVVRFPEPSA